MPTIRNPFARRPGASPAIATNNENLHPNQREAPGFERVDTVGSKASLSLSTNSSKSQDVGEYKMSVVNDSGVYLPPSPTEEKGQWPRRYLSRNSTDTRSSFGDIEHFSISRESFDSYRRSFDVSARSPIINADGPGRGSLDSARFPRLTKSAMEIKERQLPTADEAFEDVGLDDHNKQLPALPQQQRKRGFFAKFADSQDKDAPGQQSVSRFLMPSRKRGQSGQGAELGQMDQPKVMVTADGQDGH